MRPRLRNEAISGHFVRLDSSDADNIRSPSMRDGLMRTPYKTTAAQPNSPKASSSPRVVIQLTDIHPGLVLEGKKGPEKQQLLQSYYTIDYGIPIVQTPNSKEHANHCPTCSTYVLS